MNCKNCNKALKDTQKFCDECGAKVIQNRLTPKVLAAQVNEQFLSIDNKFLKTFIDLFKNPEGVICGYINGTRKRYIDVLQYFAVSLTLAGFQAFLILTFFKEQLDVSNELMNSVQNTPGNENNPFKDLKFDDFMQYQGLIYIATLPFSIVSTWLAFLIIGDKRLNFTEHCVLNIYYNSQVIIVTAFISIIMLLLNWNYLLLTVLMTIPMFLYLWYILKRVFNDRFWDSFAKWILTTVVYGIFYFAVMMIIATIQFIIQLQ